MKPKPLACLLLLSTGFLVAACRSDPDLMALKGFGPAEGDAFAALPNPHRMVFTGLVAGQWLELRVEQVRDRLMINGVDYGPVSPDLVVHLRSSGKLWIEAEFSGRSAPSPAGTEQLLRAAANRLSPLTDAPGNLNPNNPKAMGCPSLHGLSYCYELGGQYYIARVTDLTATWRWFGPAAADDPFLCPVLERGAIPPLLRDDPPNPALF